MIFGDKKLLQMVLENILDNAGKYSQRGKQIEVSVKHDYNHTSILVKDHGIRKSDINNLFKKFGRIDNSLTEGVKGTGLGLYWAKKVLDLHGGSIEIRSKINKGSTFILKIPVGKVV